MSRNNRDIKLTTVQTSAAYMLIAIGAFYNDLWEEACGMAGGDGTLSPKFKPLERRFAETLWAKPASN